MASHSTGSLPEVIRHYGEVAEMVNRREMNRFIAKIKSLWDPPSHEEEYRFDGWTSEGAFTKCIYDMALWAQDRPELPQPDESSTDAEWNEQVQIKPSLDEIHDFVPKPLILPPPSDVVIRKRLETIKINMKQQAMASGVTDVTALQLPEDLEVLLSTVNGINAAGVPSETVYTQLVYPSGPVKLPENPPAEPVELPKNLPPSEMPMDVSIRREESYGRIPIAALHFGGCTQHRSIHYVLDHPVNNTEITPEAKWRIWDRINHSINQHDDLAEWLAHETKIIEEREGGAIREVVLMFDRYPMW
jgi:hypothetical protein